MTDAVVSPSLFTGDSGQALQWLRRFQAFCTYKNFTDVKTINLFRLMLTGSAADWFDNIDFNDDSTTFDNLKVAFLLRFQPPNITKYKSTQDIFSRKQQEDESVDSFIDQMRKNARIVGMSTDTLQLAILNGLLLHLQNFVRQKEPKTLDDVVSAARMAEFTIPVKKHTDATLHAKLDKITQSIEHSKTTTALELQGDSPKPIPASFGNPLFGQPKFSGQGDLKQPNMSSGPRGQFIPPLDPPLPNHYNCQFHARISNTQSRQWGPIRACPVTSSQPGKCVRC